ncbi:4-hydroxybenzoate polyprenyl transferase [Phialophora macrospora]|uniref:4-hydroxybenzoate polyprenyl transferase n=1 Tax=Phialophora macrospora TaxID=1851006 RepID=A0A0D2FK59_9EURO|nr:4-hydroxybenzoate polyprenyl transferase [Phialophora macrospora]
MVKNPAIAMFATSNAKAPDKEKKTEKPATAPDHLAHQYGGNSISSWVSRLPVSWVPYIQLARLNPPAGLFLIYFPHLFGVLLAGVRLHAPPAELFHPAATLLGGSFFVSNAIHIWNDLIDAPLDALVERTRNRPIPRGAVSRARALIFTITQAVCAVAVLPFLNESVSSWEALLWASPGIVSWTYYPFAKRHFDVPQAVLGFCLAWGVVMGCLATGLRPVEVTTTVSVSGSTYWDVGVDWSVVCLFGACVLWSVIYDSVYAHQDRDDDIRFGIKSLAVLCRRRMKEVLWGLLALMALMLIACGVAAELSVGFYILGVGGSFVALATMIYRVQLAESASCWWWFGKGFWWVGLAISGGLLADLAGGRR